ncbi:MAG: marine proteobacterial sortase target protein [Gammaproteobacteria bacterium]|nr:marine proteobacterial sortase target protein [Gammaproteobacteria bacterium]
MNMRLVMIESKRIRQIVAAVTCCFLFVELATAYNTAGEMQFTNADGLRNPALHLATHISGEVNGMIAGITIRQTFKNDSDTWVDGRYAFPLPDGAAVQSLRIEIGERTIEGKIKEKAAARKTFHQAKKQGKKAGLLEQHRANLFSVSIANIAPYEEIVARITLVDMVHYENDTFSIRLPTTLTPRYIPGAPLRTVQAVQRELSEQFQDASTDTIIAGSGWALDTDSVVDASAITPPQIRSVAGHPINQFSLDLSVNAGLDLQSMTSQSHRITAHFASANRVDIGLSEASEPMDRDLVISWQAIAGSVPAAALFQQKFDTAHYALLMVAPPAVNSSLSLARDITFIVDSSGSMAGNSMAQARQALHDGLAYLTANDRFNIIDFDSRFRPLFKHSVAVTARSLNTAHAMIDGLDADGGTEMMGALTYALRQSPDANNRHRESLRQIVFITDGAVGNEAELFKLLHDELGKARLFTVGIGSAPNAFFMRRAAKFGRGSYTYISDLQRVSVQMATLFKRITHPVLKDIKVDWGQQNIEQYPARLPDLYSGEPLTLLVKSDAPIDKLSISGSMLEMPWQQTISGGNAGPANTRHLDIVWARQKVAMLMDQLTTDELPPEQVKPAIVELGLAHGLLTKFTSFVAVEQAPGKPAGAKSEHRNVPNLMPHGSSMAIPQTATPAAMFTLLGSLLLLLGGVLRRLGRKGIRCA